MQSGHRELRLYVECQRTVHHAAWKRNPKFFYFETLFSGRWETQKQADGAMFVDRSPRWVEYIMDYVRDDASMSTLWVWAERGLLLEARYY